MQARSFETALKVNSIDEEYDYLESILEGFKLIEQKLVVVGDHSYDVMRVSTKDHGEKLFYFDVSSWAGYGDYQLN
jgi:hypothetical protein